MKFLWTGLVWLCDVESVKTKSVAIALAVGALVAPLSAAALPAQTAPKTDLKDALSITSTVESDVIQPVLEDNVALSYKPDSAVVAEATINASEVSIPLNPADGVTYGDITIGLPTSSAAEDAQSVQPGVVGYDDEQFSVAVALKSSADLQFSTVVSDASAPTRFDYELTLPSGAELSLGANGSAWAIGADSEFLLGVESPWAVDANGQEVPTHFEVHGHTLTQVVDHSSGSYAYPIVADPYAGRNIFDRVTTYQPHKDQVDLVLSSWGRAIQLGQMSGDPSTGWAKGQQILQKNGWDEAVARGANVLNTKATYRHQYDCHRVGAYTPYTGGTAWNLEGWRAPKANWLSDNPQRHKCNW